MSVYTGLEWKQRGRLLVERDQLRGLLDRLRAAGTSRPDSESHDVTVDEAAIQADVIEGRLAAIDEALDPINSGSYGVCLTCGAAISSKRLEALPATAACGVARAANEWKGV